jgi:RHS repeat-associated protein
LLFFAVRTAYDDFGNLATNSSETISNSFKYVGKFGVQTDLPDLLYMRARYYLPSVGRFINHDPIGLGGELNLYAYVENNPINKSDPIGLQSLPISLPIPIPPIPIHRIEKDPISGLQPYNAGRNANGKCNPCRPNTIWEASGNKHGSKCGKHYHGIVWNQDPITCICYPKRVSGSDPNNLK